MSGLRFKMNRMQIKLNLALNILGIPVSVKNYRQICDAAYLAEQQGIHISPAKIMFDQDTGHAYSPLTHEDAGYPSRNLKTDILEIQAELASRRDDSELQKLDNISIEKLKGVRTTLISQKSKPSVIAKI